MKGGSNISMIQFCLCLKELGPFHYISNNRHLYLEFTWYNGPSCTWTMRHIWRLLYLPSHNRDLFVCICSVDSCIEMFYSYYYVNYIHVVSLQFLISISLHDEVDLCRLNEHIISHCPLLDSVVYSGLLTVAVALNCY